MLVDSRRIGLRNTDTSLSLLEEAGRQLEAVIRQNKGLRNSDLRKFTAQLEKLIAMWKRDDD